MKPGAGALTWLAEVHADRLVLYSEVHVLTLAAASFMEHLHCVRKFNSFSCSSPILVATPSRASCRTLHRRCLFLFVTVGTVRTSWLL